MSARSNYSAVQTLQPSGVRSDVHGQAGYEYLDRNKGAYISSYRGTSGRSSQRQIEPALQRPPSPRLRLPDFPPPNQERVQSSRSTSTPRPSTFSASRSPYFNANVGPKPSTGRKDANSILDVLKCPATVQPSASSSSRLLPRRQSRNGSSGYDYAGLVPAVADAPRTKRIGSDFIRSSQEAQPLTGPNSTAANVEMYNNVYRQRLARNASLDAASAPGLQKQAPGDKSQRVGVVNTAADSSQSVPYASQNADVVSPAPQSTHRQATVDRSYRGAPVVKESGSSGTLIVEASNPPAPLLKSDRPCRPSGLTKEQIPSNSSSVAAAATSTGAIGVSSNTILTSTSEADRRAKGQDSSISLDLKVVEPAIDRQGYASQADSTAIEHSSTREAEKTPLKERRGNFEHLTRETERTPCKERQTSFASNSASAPLDRSRIQNTAADARSSGVEQPQASSSALLGGAAVQGLQVSSLPIPKPSPVATREYAPGTGCVGLQNLGNTCFMNSILQALNAVRDLVTHLQPQKSYTNKQIVASALGELFSQVWGSSFQSVVSPSLFLKKISKYDSRWGEGRQQDSQEFLHSVLESLQVELNRVTSKPAYKQLEGKGTEEQQAAEAEAYARSWHDSIIDDIFGGQLQSTIDCQVCHHRSHCFEPFLDLMIPLPNTKTAGVSVQECLESFVEVEKLDGTESFRCEKCKKCQPVTKRLQIYRFPKILILTLKRFSSRSGSLFGRFLSASKNNIAVNLEVDRLDLTAYCNPVGLRGQFKLNGGCQPIYQLIALSHHSGSLDGGHYTASCRSWNDNTWYHFNDTAVRRESKPSAPSQSAYVLFYQLVST